MAHGADSKCGCKGTGKPDIRQIPFNGRMVTLRGPSSQQLQLSALGPQVVAFEPENSEAFEVEVRARLMSTSAATETIPIARWWTEVSAGNSVWKEPFPTPTDLIQVASFAIPARGMVWRTSARQFRIAFFLDGSTAGSSVTNGVLQVTVMPVRGGVVDSYPFQDSASFLETPPRAHPFPMTAREWKVTGATGLPVTPAGSLITFITNGGLPYAATDATEFGDWNPIPFDAVAWAAPSGIYAAYR